MTFHGSTIFADMTSAAQKTDSALRGELLDQALRRHWLARVEDAKLDKSAIALARVLAAVGCRTKDGLDALGSLSSWGLSAGYERTAVAPAIRRLEAANLVKILDWREGGRQAIHLELLFRPEHWQQAEREANERRTQLLTA